MGIKERQERDREAVRRAILDAARDLFVRDGFQNISIRKIAERIEYSPAAIYGYFPGKDDIFFALAEEGFHLLHDPGAYQKVAHLPPVERLQALFWHFYQFSCAHPQHFALMFLDQSVPRITHVYERFAFAREMKHKFFGQIQHCIDEGALPKTVPPNVVFRLFIAGLMGIAAMRLSDRLTPGEDPDALARDVLNVMIAGLRAGTPVQSRPVGCLLDAEHDPNTVREGASR
jgi:AcrR family transcriptional regulator